MIGKALLPASTSGAASPEASSSAPAAVLEPNPVTKVEASTEPAPVVNSIPKAEVEADSPPTTPTPLSPYPYVIIDPSYFTFLIILIFSF